MADIFPIDKLYRVGVVVWDLKKAAKDYTEVYGIEDWKVVHHTPDRLHDSAFYGRKVQHGYSSAIGYTPGGAIRFELIQPGAGASTFKQFLYSRGEGVHHLLLRSGDAKDLADLRDWLGGQGIRVIQSGSVDGLVQSVPGHLTGRPIKEQDQSDPSPLPGRPRARHTLDISRMLASGLDRGGSP